MVLPVKSIHCKHGRYVNGTMYCAQSTLHLTPCLYLQTVLQAGHI